MEKRIRNYLSYMEEQLKKDLTVEEKTRIMKDLLIQIGFFQHERLIHLIVTIAFAILTFLSFIYILLMPGIGFILLTSALLILLIPYIRHYYILENSVQKLYVCYDTLFKSFEEVFPEEGLDHLI